MIFHVVAMPQTLTTKAFSMCGFTQKTIRFCWMMKSLGHKVFLYGGEINDAVCDEHIVCFIEEVNYGKFKTLRFSVLGQKS